ncbi:phage holin family protein [Enterococcus casseliflavus]|uniref:phage holin family protein n=1 Tax=Enterococcus casseliflavus TaxID=37734 RepID=UPI003D6C1F67
MNLNYISIVGGLIAFLFGQWHIFLTILLFIQFLDLVSMILKYANEGKLNSTELKKEIIGKFAVWVLITLSHMIDVLLFQGISVVQNSVVFLFIGQEGMSILETMNSLGLKVPDFLAKYFRDIESKATQEQEKDKDE